VQFELQVSPKSVYAIIAAPVPRGGKNDSGVFPATEDRRWTVNAFCPGKIPL